MFNFALEDWIPLRIGGRLECYVRPDRPYTIMIDNELNKVALTPERSSNSNWYFREYMRLLELDQVLSLSQASIYQLELRALLSEKDSGIYPGNFYLSLDALVNSEFMYTSVYRVTLVSENQVEQIGWLGIRNRKEYHMVSNCLEYLSWPKESLQCQKSTNIMASLTGENVVDAREVAHSPNGFVYVWHVELAELQAL